MMTSVEPERQSSRSKAPSPSSNESFHRNNTSSSAAQHPFFGFRSADGKEVGEIMEELRKRRVGIASGTRKEE
jgi:hypothetical protein